MSTDDGLSAGYRRLAVAVLLQAVKDAMGKGYKAEPGDREQALAWLRSIEARDWAAALEMDRGLERWLSQATGRQDGERNLRKPEGECSGMTVNDSVSGPSGGAGYGKMLENVGVGPPV